MKIAYKCNFQQFYKMQVYTHTKKDDIVQTYLIIVW